MVQITDQPTKTTPDPGDFALIRDVAAGSDKKTPLSALGPVVAPFIPSSSNENYVPTSQSSAVQTYGDNLATTGPTVTVTIKSTGLALVVLTSYLSNSAANNSSFVGVALSGANTVAASDDRSIQYEAYGANAYHRASGVFLFTGLTPGATTFKMQYRVDGNTGTFANRRIAVVPL